jgi:hypothetical protein
MIEKREDEIGVREEEQNLLEQPLEQPEPKPVKPILLRIQKACLAFYIALLN